MAPLNYVKKARKAIYERGKQIKYPGRVGSKREGQMIRKIDRTQPATPQDVVYIRKGESYYWWQFKNGAKNYSREKPRRSRLTQSEFLSTLWDIEDDINEATADTVEELEGLVEDWKQRIEELRDQCEESRSNMPEGLQDSPTGELLQERYDGLDSWLSDIDGIDIDVDEEALREEAADDVVAPTLEDPGVDIEEAYQNLLDEKIGELLGELQNTNSGVG